MLKSAVSAKGSETAFSEINGIHLRTPEPGAGIRMEPRSPECWVAPSIPVLSSAIRVVEMDDIDTERTVEVPGLLDRV